MNINDFFPSRFLAASDFNDQPQTLTIRGVEIEKMDDGTIKPSIWFNEANKPLLANKTNCLVIAKQYGTETDSWTGRPVELFPTTTTYKGETVPCIRCRIPQTVEAAAEPPAEPTASQPMLASQPLQQSPFQSNGSRQPVTVGR